MLKVWENAGINNDLNIVFNDIINTVLDSEEYQRALLFNTQLEIGSSLNDIAISRNDNSYVKLYGYALYSPKYIEVEVNKYGIDRVYITPSYLYSLYVNNLDDFFRNCVWTALLFVVNTDFYVHYGDIVTHPIKAYRSCIQYKLESFGEDMHSFYNLYSPIYTLLATHCHVSESVLHVLNAKYRKQLVLKGIDDISILLDVLNEYNEQYYTEQLIIYLSNKFVHESLSLLGFIHYTFKKLLNRDLFVKVKTRAVIHLLYDVMKEEVVDMLYPDVFVYTVVRLCSEHNLSFVLHVDEARYTRSIEVLHTLFDNSVLSIDSLENW